METEDSGQPHGRGRGDGMPSVKLGVGLRGDVITLWEELDEARNTLAEIQALQSEIKDPKSTPGQCHAPQTTVSDLDSVQGNHNAPSPTPPPPPSPDRRPFFKEEHTS